ncbi:MAG: M13 family metallopeptidase [Paludibacteraceae bacterium]|nr:M13 family metallopeptidase [Paludibacteraceae bacterium]
MKFKHLTMIALACTMVACGGGQTPKKELGIGIDFANMDTLVDFRTDFYEYACGGWMKANPLTPEYSRYGSFDALAENNRKQLNELITELAEKPNKERGSIEQKIGDLYNLAMDSTRRNEMGIKPLLPELERIAALERKDLSRFLGEDLYCGLWGMYVDADIKNSSMNLLQTSQGGFALGEKDYYFSDDPAMVEIRAKYQEHIAKMFQLFGYEEDEAIDAAKTVLRMETRLAGAAKSNVELRDPEANYNKMTIDELQQLVPQVDWKVFLAALNVSTENISVGQIEHLKDAGRMLAEESMDDLRTLFFWQAYDGAAGELSDAVYMHNFEFYGKVLSGREEPSPRWKRAVSTVGGTLGEAVGEMYVAKYFPPEAKERMLQLVRNLQTALGERIDNLTWMSDSTKARAHEKLDAFYVKIGYPDKWRDYSALDIDPELSFLENMERASRFEQAYDFSFVDKPVDRDRWYMTPQTVNAYYNPTTNEITFPAGILQYPFFDMNADDAFNYGAIGVVIGHEMTHGFDDQGAQFDKDGNLNNWWTADDKANFDARTKVMADFFSNIIVLDTLHANGKLTLGENIADHGGLQIAFQAFKNATRDNPLPTVDGFTPEQRFFIAYANVWAGNIRDEEIRNRTTNDPHSLGRWRVNGALPHIQAWYDAFGITEESPMYVAPEKRVSIW